MRAVTHEGETGQQCDLRREGDEGDPRLRDPARPGGQPEPGDQPTDRECDEQPTEPGVVVGQPEPADPQHDDEPDHGATGDPLAATRPGSAGGESVVVDGYRLVERLRSAAPELYEFLATVDVDVTSRNTNPDVRRVPRVCRMVEWTRGGRMIVRVAELAQPMPRESRWAEHERLIESYVDVCATLAAQIRDDTTLAAGEVLVIDNYRCLHGVRGHEGRRRSYVLRCTSSQAR